MVEILFRLVTFVTSFEMKKLLVITMLLIFSQATVCITAMYFLDHLELITLVDTSSAGTMIEEEETDEEFSCNSKEEIIIRSSTSEKNNLQYFHSQDYYLLPGFTDRVFSPPEFGNC
jgi:predicted RNA-binding Zn-ribbon protein involved in translation (DUF1610 family)